MAIDRLIVIGASSGGIDALTTLIGALPADFAAPICVVHHTAPESPAILDRIFGRHSALRVSMARTGDRLRPGQVYVAPPDQHLLIEPGVLCLARGPKENRFRPATDPLFRSAAQVYGPRVIGVVLTGNLDDGAAGLWAIHQLGGIAVVQDPADAQAPSMPSNALRLVPDAHVVAIDRMPALFEQLLATSVHEAAVAAPRHLEVEVRIAKDEPPLSAGLLGLGEPSTYTCPECHGVLLAMKDGNHVRYRCHTGHAYSVESLAADLSHSIEDALANAERALQEGDLLVRHLADELDPDFDRERIDYLRSQAEQAGRQAQVVRRLLSERAALLVARGQ